MQTRQISVDILGKMEVAGEDHEPVKLSTLWMEQPAVIVFVRHFG